jgi:hypothetical protein
MPQRDIDAGRFPEPNLSMRVAYTDHHGTFQVMTIQSTTTDPTPIAAAELRLAIDRTFERLGWEIGSAQLLLQQVEEVELKALPKVGFTVIKGSKVA